MNNLTKVQLILAGRALLDLSERIDVQELFVDVTEELFNRITKTNI